MTDIIIPFPSKQQNEINHVKTPEQALEHVIDMIKRGETQADKMVISWVGESDEIIEYRYVIGGDLKHAEVIGLLEVTKATFMDEA